MNGRLSRRRFLQNALAGGAALPLTGGKSLDFREEGPAPPSLHQIRAAGQAEDEERFWELIRLQFPLTRDRIYFNTSGLGASPRHVIDAVLDKTMELETISETGHDQVPEVHKKIAGLFSVDPEEIALTRNTTEGMNIFAREIPLERGDEVLLSTHEHPGAYIPWMAVMKDKGIKINLFELDYRNAANNTSVIEKHLTKKTKAVSIDHIPCTTGTVLPAKEIVRLCRSRGILIGIDGAHPPGQMPVNLRDIDPDFYALSGHKWLLGPKGTGILFINKNIMPRLNPVFVGAYSDRESDFERLKLEYRMEANREEYGTRSTPLVWGLGAAVDFIQTVGVTRIQRRGRALAGYLKEGLARIPRVDVMTPLDPDQSAAIVTFRVGDMAYGDVQRRLQKEFKCRVRGILEHGLNAVRISCAVYNSFAEMDILLDGVRKIATGAAALAV
jgi:selenocysteine lyase/cysteine desulfurase